MAETNYTAIDFNDLTPADDGKTIIYSSGALHKSDKTLGEEVESKILDKGYATESAVNNTINALSGTITTNYATKEDLGKVGNFIITEGDDSGPSLDPASAQTKSIYLILDDTVTGNDQYSEWIVTTGTGTPVWTCIGETTVNLSQYVTTSALNDTLTDYQPVSSMESYYTKSETSAASAISGALALKEDKIFVAEYNVTTYQELLDAYNAGKKIICNYYPAKESLPSYIIVLKFNEYSPIQGLFKFSVQTADTAFKYVQCTFNNGDTSNTTWYEETTHYYDTTATSGAQQIADALNTKQNNLTFSYKNGVITAINSNAVGKIQYAGIDLIESNGAIKVNTNGTTGNPSEMSFVAGSATYASGIGSVAFGLETSAWGKSVFVEGHKTSAEGYYSHAEGEMTHASGYEAHAEGGKTSAYGSHTHAEGGACIASGANTHVEGQNVSAFMENAHAEGYKTYIIRGEKTDGVYYGAHAEGSATSAIGCFAHAEGGMCIASGGNSGLYGAHAEGGKTSAFGAFSHTEGGQTVASGEKAHAEGEFTSAFGGDSHAEGKWTLAKGTISHAEGIGTSAVGNFSHAGGYYTITTYTGTTVVGKYNKLDTNNSSTNAAFIVGNGANNIVRSDAFVVNWNGVASATKLATSGIADIETSITALQTQLGNIDSILQNI